VGQLIPLGKCGREVRGFVVEQSCKAVGRGPREECGLALTFDEQGLELGATVWVAAAQLGDALRAELGRRVEEAVHERRKPSPWLLLIRWWSRLVVDHCAPGIAALRWSVTRTCSSGGVRANAQTTDSFSPRLSVDGGSTHD